MAERETALIVGVGPGLGAALARRFADAGMNVGLAARDSARLAPLVDALASSGGDFRAYACDATNEAAVDALFAQIASDLGDPALVVYNAGTFVPRAILDIGTDEFEACWRVGCLGGFLVGRAAARTMAEAGRGTIVFTGATASLRGAANFANLAVGKFGLRALAQSMARELGSRGVHVAHVIIDGVIMSERDAAFAVGRGPDALLDADAIAENYLALHRQHRSAWTLEMDLRRWAESF